VGWVVGWKFPNPSPQRIYWLAGGAASKHGSHPRSCGVVLLDRRDRQAYVSERDQAMILFAIIEPEEGDADYVFVDGMLMSPGSEDYNLPPAPELVDQFRRFLDGQVQVSKAPESGCWGSKRIASQVSFETLLCSG
jgi:hypothetical protein